MDGNLATEHEAAIMVYKVPNTEEESAFLYMEAKISKFNSENKFLKVEGVVSDNLISLLFEVTSSEVATRPLTRSMIVYAVPKPESNMAEPPALLLACHMRHMFEWLQEEGMSCGWLSSPINDRSTSIQYSISPVLPYSGPNNTRTGIELSNELVRVGNAISQDSKRRELINAAIMGITGLSEPINPTLNVWNSSKINSRNGEATGFVQFDCPESCQQCVAVKTVRARDGRYEFTVTFSSMPDFLPREDCSTLAIYKGGLTKFEDGGWSSRLSLIVDKFNTSPLKDQHGTASILRHQTSLDNNWMYLDVSHRVIGAILCCYPFQGRYFRPLFHMNADRSNFKSVGIERYRVLREHEYRRWRVPRQADDYDEVADIPREFSHVYPSNNKRRQNDHEASSAEPVMSTGDTLAALESKLGYYRREGLKWEGVTTNRYIRGRAINDQNIEAVSKQLADIKAANTPKIGPRITSGERGSQSLVLDKDVPMNEGKEPTPPSEGGREPDPQR